MIILFSSGPSYVHRPLHQPVYFVRENFHSFYHKFNGCQKKVARFLYMVQGCSQKEKEKNLFILFSSQIWLYWLTDDRCLSYIRKSKKEKTLM
jgi:hypothetical protein